MEGFGAGRLVVLARWWRSLILESGSAHFVVLLTVGTLACRAIGVGPIGTGSLAVQALGALLVVKVGSVREWLVRGLVGVVVSLGKVCNGRSTLVRSAQLVVISRMCLSEGWWCPRSGEECGFSWCWGW